MAAIYHVMKPVNGSIIVEAVSSMGTACTSGYFGGYNTHLKPYMHGNPPVNSPLPAGWKGVGKSKIGHIK